MHEEKSFSVNNSKSNTEAEFLNGSTNPTAQNKIQQFNNSLLTKPKLLIYQNNSGGNLTSSMSLKDANGSENNDSKCFVCSYELVNNSLQLLNDIYCHRECFKCNKCEKIILDKNGYNIVDNKYICCEICHTRRKPLHSLIDTLNVTNTNSGVILSSATLSTSNTFTLNDLKLKFEPTQSHSYNTKLSNSDSYKPKHHACLKTSEQFRQSVQSFSSSMPQNTLSSLNSPSPHCISNPTSSMNHKCHNGAINQRISALKSLASRQYSNSSKSSYNSDSLDDSNNSTNKLFVQFSSKSNQPEGKSSLLKPIAHQNNKDEYENTTNTWILNQQKKIINKNEAPIILQSKCLQPQTKTHINIDKKSNDCFIEHSIDCRVILQKSHRRSKSLPAKFNIDSLLDYLNYSLILNKYGMKKLNHQRNLQINSPNYNFSVGHNNITMPNYYNHSSGYNSENHSNSSNSNLISSYQKYDDSLNISQHNFYKLSLNHLPINFLHLHCTCGANKVNSESLNNCPSFAEESHKSILHSSLQSSSTNQINFNDEEDDEDDDFSDDDIEEEEVDEQIDRSLNEITISHSVNKKLTNKSDNSTTNFHHQWVTGRKDTDFSPRFKSNDMRYHLMTCAFTTDCQHTARFDLRRIRSYRDLVQRQLIYSPSDFIIKEKIGEGFFANVSKIILKKTNQEMVLKELKFDFADNKSEDIPILPEKNECNEPLSNIELNAAHKSFLKEAQVLRNLNHPNVIKFIGIMFKKEKHLNLILEFISGGTLKDIIHNINKQLPWKLRVGYAKDISAAMQYLHSLNIIHRDLKSDNCLVKNNGRTVVVADFGLSRVIKHNNHNFKKFFIDNLSKTRENNASKFNNCRELLIQNGSSSQTNSKKISSDSQKKFSTNSYIVAAKSKLKKRTFPQRKQRYAVVGNSFSMAPEMLKHQIYDERVDIFSFGIICCEIIGRVQADPDYLPRTSDFGLNVELFRMKYCEPACPKQFIKIAIACCELEPEKRPPFSKTSIWLETILSHVNANTPIPKNLLKHMG